jgi:fructose/tagatose bisphosphate aldolase
MLDALCIETYEDMQAILQVVSRVGAPVDLITPEGGACYAGPAYWHAMLILAAKEFPQASYRLLVDCDDEAGTVMKALSCGLKTLLCDTALPSFAALSEMAVQQGAFLMARPASIRQFPPGLAFEKKQALVEQWLGERAQSSTPTSSLTEVTHAY